MQHERPLKMSKQLAVSPPKKKFLFKHNTFIRSNLYAYLVNLSVKHL